MKQLTLVIGNRNYSSWSMRAWLALEQTGAEFREEQIFFDEDLDRAQRRRFSPTGRVPVLLVDDHAVWDSLAIGETLAELFPTAGLWPADARARSRARSLCAELHAGFPALRSELPLNCRARRPTRSRSAAVEAEVRRISEMWSETRAEFGAGGELLFGARSLADAFYTPIASRLLTYGIELEGPALKYAQAVLALPAVERWTRAAAAEDAESAEYDAIL